MVAADQVPVLATVVGAPQHADVIGRGEFAEAAGFDQGVDTRRVVGGDRQADLAERLDRKTTTFAGQLGPCRAAVSRLVDAAAGAAALSTPRPDLHLPHGRIKDARVGRVHGEIHSARVLVDEQDAFPVAAAVQGAVNAAFLLGAVQVTERGHVDDVRVGRMNHDPADAAAVVEPHVLPALAAVSGLVDTVANDDVAADEALTSARPHDVGIARRDRQRADRLHRLIVENRAPVDAAIGALEDPARRCSDQVRVGVARHADNGAHSVADRSDVAIAQPVECIGPELLCLGCRARRDERERQGDDQESAEGHGFVSLLRSMGQQTPLYRFAQTTPRRGACGSVTR